VWRSKIRIISQPPTSFILQQFYLFFLGWTLIKHNKIPINPRLWFYFLSFPLAITVEVSIPFYQMIQENFQKLLTFNQTHLLLKEGIICIQTQICYRSFSISMKIFSILICFTITSNNFINFQNIKEFSYAQPYQYALFLALVLLSSCNNFIYLFSRLNYHTNFPKSCPDCGLVLSTKHAFVKHVNTLHSTAFQESTVPCEICGKLGQLPNTVPI
jgi:hypothetical protein